jgi:hypothetical protein
MHPPLSPQKGYSDYLTSPLIGKQRTFNKCYLASLKKSEIGDDSLYASAHIEN